MDEIYRTLGAAREAELLATAERFHRAQPFRRDRLPWTRLLALLRRGRPRDRVEAAGVVAES
jgi:hypothetical protein